MKVAAGVAVASLVLVLAYLWNVHDLRGWEGAYPEDPARIQATLPGKPDFTLADCVPGAIDEYGSPSAEEYSGSATVTVLTCRSRSSALTVLLIYLALAGAAVVALRLMKQRR